MVIVNRQAHQLAVEGAAIAGYEWIDFAIGSGMNTKLSFHRR
jgi:hypothetical protein